MDKFWELFKENVIIQGILALMFAATACYLYAAQIPVPMELVALLSVILGYFFGSKTLNAVIKSRIREQGEEYLQDPRIEGLIDQARDAQDYD